MILFHLTLLLLAKRLGLTSMNRSNTLSVCYLLVNGTDRYHTLVSVLAVVQQLSRCYLLVSKGADTRAVLAVWLRRTVQTSCGRTLSVLNVLAATRYCQN